ncbi:MerR family transcriptional regulator [Paenibacillus soyae]|uniref:MerR family transcriptional regulator n=1 Tax=Paenibacillus soyae TaxID=2969249 RepID=A0A9X2MWU3_9BACL|nr:MerR family transcriptional regulator [Paenibacillus soyae]MCR2807900.1 MerR family transcriptional regulator [Paenibacillus soyae]
MSKEVHYSVGEFARLTGISVRTLHYYDEIGLLKARKNDRTGHRQYHSGDIVRLQKIVTLKFLGYSLEQILPLVQQETFDSDLLDTLLAQKRELEEQRSRIDIALKAINRATAVLQDAKEVDSHVLIGIIHSIQTEKEQREWLERYVPSEAVSGLYDRSEEELEELDRRYVELVQEVKRLVGTPVEDPAVQQLVDEQLKINIGFVGEDSYEALSGLADLDEEKLKELEALIPTPFTPEEERWLQQAMEHYMKQNGLS